MAAFFYSLSIPGLTKYIAEISIKNNPKLPGIITFAETEKHQMEPLAVIGIDLGGRNHTWFPDWI